MSDARAGGMGRGPRRALVVTGRRDPTRDAALRDALGHDVLTTTVTASAPLPPLDGFDAVVLDGPQSALAAESVAEIRGRVHAGAALVALGAADGADGPLADLLGAHRDGSAPPEGEVFAKVADSAHPLTRRLDPEFPVADRFTPLRARNGAMRAVLAVNVAYRDHPATLAGRVGAGTVVVSGLGNTVDALRAQPLRTLLRRAVAGDGHPPERPLGVGIVGYGPYGGMGYAHGLAVSAVDGLELVSACDRVPERLAAAEREFPGIRTVASAEEIAADPAVDVVVVATPPAFHAELAMKMLRAGKHVVCEKPLCLRVADADALIAAAGEHGVVLTVNQNRRFDPDFLAVRRAVDAGMLGELFNVETFVGGFEHPCRAWHSHTELSGGAVYDWGSHHVDQILQLLPGIPVTVSANGHKRVWHDVTNLDQLRVRMLWADGREAQFVQSDVAAVRPPRFYVQGTAGTLEGRYREVAFERIEPGIGYVRETAHHAEAPADLVLRRYESGYGLVETRLPPMPRPHFAFHRNLADHLHLAEPLAVTPESVRDVVAVLEAATISASRGGAPVAPLDAVGG